jgi:hypothetical protein
MKRFVLFAIFLISISMVSAEFSQQDAKTWLDENIVWNSASFEELSFATIVLESPTGLNKLVSKKDSQTGCFPKNNCNSKDTALATLALSNRNQNIEKQLEYLENNLKASTDFNKQEWNIQVVVNEAGSCIVSYEEKEEEGISFNFGEDGNLEGKDNAWINFNNLPGFNFDKPTEDIGIECEFETASPRISIIKISGNSFYIIEERSSSVANFVIENGCYSTGSGSSCDKESSFYTSWVLKKLGKELTTENYLRDEAITDFDYAMLSKIDNSQLPVLISKQKQDGSFNSDVYATSFAIDSLKGSNYLSEISEAKTWVEGQQSEEGSIGNGIKDTSVALYLIYEEGLGYRDDEGGDSGGNGGSIICETDSVCDLLVGERCNLETNRCEVPSAVGCSGDSDCNNVIGEICDFTRTCVIPGEEPSPVCNNFICEEGEDDPFSSFYCISDCQGPPQGGDDRRAICGDNLCLEGEDEDSCPFDCEVESEGGSLWWLWLIVIILVLGGGTFFVLMKLKKGGGRKEAPSYLQRPGIPPASSPQQRYTPPARRRSPRDEALEGELDRSIKEAQNLLRKKK